MFYFCKGHNFLKYNKTSKIFETVLMIGGRKLDFTPLTQYDLYPNTFKKIQFYPYHFYFISIRIFGSVVYLSNFLFLKFPIHKKLFLKFSIGKKLVAKKFYLPNFLFSKFSVGKIKVEKIFYLPNFSFSKYFTYQIDEIFCFSKFPLTKK